MAEAIELDSVDRKIIEQLLIDGRISFSAIAKQISLTDVAIKKRFERLVKRGIVSSIKAELNLKLLGYENPIYVQIMVFHHLSLYPNLHLFYLLHK